MLTTGEDVLARVEILTRVKGSPGRLRLNRWAIRLEHLDQCCSRLFGGVASSEFVLGIVPAMRPAAKTPRNKTGWIIPMAYAPQHRQHLTRPPPSPARAPAEALTAPSKGAIGIRHH